jgi:dihydroneopterin aldolase
MIEIELRGLEVFGHHGVDEEEWKRGQTLLWDVAWLQEEPSKDDISATVDYRAVAECVTGVSSERRFHLLEALASAAADAILERFPIERVRVRVRKPTLGLPVEYSAATDERDRA